jgi:energy-coupling factor transporter ATP-binding protein EcfA2
MIRRVEVRGLRALRYVSVDLRPFQVLVGPNASGKSTFFDAIHVVHDILNAGLERALFGDARFGIPRRCSDPRELSWLGRGGRIEIALDIGLPDDVSARTKDGYRFARYEVAVQTDGVLGFGDETLWLYGDEAALERPSPRQGDLFPMSPEVPPTLLAAHGHAKTEGWRKVVSKIAGSGNDYFRAENSKWNNQFRLGPGKSALANLPEDEEKFPASTWVKRLLMEGVQRLELNAEAMRLPSPAGTPASFLPDGSNLPWVVHQLENDDKERFQRWVEHLTTALPDLVGIRTNERPEDRSRYLVAEYRNGLSAPSWLLSDGTLRMLALTLLAYAPNASKLVLIEEPENGIHPRAVESVLQSLTSVYDGQVFCATHSTLLLSQVKPSDLLCFAKTADGAVDVVRGDEHPQLKEWKSSLHLGDLFAAGVLG